MSVGKYSPTVSRWYAKDQNWWNKNGHPDPGGEAAGGRWLQKTLCHSRRRRQWLRKNHDHRQAGGEIQLRRQKPDACRRRHVSRRRHRTAAHLGRADECAGNFARAGRRRRRPGLRRDSGGAGTEDRHPADGYGGPTAKSHRTDGRAGKNRPGDEKGRCGSAPCGSAGARRHGRPERLEPGRDFWKSGRGDRSGDDQARRHGARRHPGRDRRKIRAPGAFHRRRRTGRRPRALHRPRFRPGDRRFR